MGPQVALLMWHLSVQPAKESPTNMQRTPTHPGAILREDVIPAIGKSLGDVARDLSISKSTLSRILAERVGISADMAVRLGKYLGNGAEFWMTLQMDLELAKAREGLAHTLPGIKTIKKKTILQLGK